MKRTIKSVKPIEKNLLTKEQIDESLSCLSDIELNQLGKGDFPNIEEWCQFRKFLEERSIVSNPLLNKEFTKILIKRKPLDSSMGMNFYALNY